jgi:hypothetical protein
MSIKNVYVNTRIEGSDNLEQAASVEHSSLAKLKGTKTFLNDLAERVYALDKMSLKKGAEGKPGQP